jgi:hypothetical protein
MTASSATADAHVRIPLNLCKPLNAPTTGEIAVVLHHGDIVELVITSGTPVYLRLAEARRLVLQAGPNLLGRPVRFDGLLLELRGAAGE